MTPTNDTLIPSDENYTPVSLLSPCRYFLGGFDLDPFSCAKANEIVKATYYFSKNNDAFSHDWTPFKSKWVNPPYSRYLIGKAIAKTLEYVHIGETLLLVNSSTSTKWFHACMLACSAYMHPRQRIQFDSPYREIGKRSSNEYDQTLFYFGDRPIEFAQHMSNIGDSVQPIKLK